MRSIILTILLLPSLLYSQVTLKTRYLYSDTAFVTRRLDSGIAKFDSVWARKYSNLPPGGGIDTTIYIMSFQSGIVDTIPKTGRTIPFLHSFTDTGYVVEMRGYRGLTGVSLTIKRWADSLRFYPAEDSTTVEWNAQSVSPIAGTVIARQTGTSINFVHSLVVPNYCVSVLGVKNNAEVTVGVVKSPYSITLYPAKDSTQVMWAIASITQGTVIPSIGNSERQGTSSFVSNTTRLAIYVPGVTTSNKFATGSISLADGTLPVAGDLCSGITKTDSLIIQRSSGTTSGLGVWYIQVK